MPLLACSQPISESTVYKNLTDADENTVIYGASSLGSDKSVGEHGIFWHEISLLKYYDVKAKESYVICSKSNCRHSDSSCSGWYAQPFDASGLALYGKNVYAIKLNEGRNAYELISMDISGNNQKAVSSFAAGDYSKEGWILSSLQDVCYIGGRAWFRADYYYSYGINTGQKSSDTKTACSLFGVNLKDGSRVVINELPASEDEMTPELYAECCLEYISKDYAMICKIWNAAEKLTEEEFKKEFAEGKYSEFKDSEDPYYDYLEWHSYNSEYVYSYLLYDIQNGSLSEFEKGVPDADYDDGRIGGIYSPYIFSGSFENKILYHTFDYRTVYSGSSGTSVFTFDPKNKKTELVLDIKCGTLLFAEGFGFSISSSVLDNEKLLYCIFKGSGKADICTYNLRTKEHAVLYEDDERITFRIIGEMSGKYIGYKVDFKSDTQTLSSISKEDYMKGNLNASEKLF